MGLSLLLDVPMIQNYVVHKAAEMASRKLETTVSIDRVRIGLFNRIRLNGFYVEDYQRDTLLYAGEVRALVSGVGLFGGGLSLAYGEIDDAKLFLKETPEGVMNIKQVTDRLSKGNGNGRFRLTISSAAVTNLELHIERLEHRNPEYGVDYGNMRLYELTGRVRDLLIAGAAVSGDVEQMSFRELSGFEMTSMHGGFLVDKGLITLTEAEIATDRSDIRFEYLTLDGEGWSSYKEFIRNVVIDASAYDSSVSSDDVAFFAPGFRRWQTHLDGLTMTMKGTVDNFSGSIAGTRFDEGSELRADVAAKGLPDYRRTDFDIDLHELVTDGGTVERLASNIARTELSEGVAGILHRAGTLGLSGKFTGRLDNFRARGELLTDAGDAGVAAVMAPDSSRGHSLRARVRSHGLNVGRLAGSGKLKSAEFVVRADGSFGEGYDFDVQGDVARIGVGDYVCENISLHGTASDGDIDAAVSVHDRSLETDMKIVLGLEGDRPSYDIIADVQRADLAAMGINRRDTVSVLSAGIGISADGRIPDELNGRLSVADAHYLYDSGEVSSEYMEVVMASNEDTRSVTLTSEFADVTFESRSNYREVWSYLKEFVGNYLPLLYAEGRLPASEHDEDEEHDHRMSVVSIKTKDFTPVADALLPGLEVADGSTFGIMLDPACNRFGLRAETDYIEHDRLLAVSLQMDMSNRDDSLAMSLNAGDLYWGTFHLLNVNLHAAARDNIISLSGRFRDTTKYYSAVSRDSVSELSGFVGLRAMLRRDSLTGRRGMDISFAPSYIARRDSRWEIASEGIEADSGRINIRNFSIRNSRQELLVNGVASRSREDSLMLHLHDFDLAPLAQITSRLGYAIEGRSNGFAKMKAALHNGEFTANIRLDSLEVNGLPVRPLEFRSQWDFLQNRARLMVAANEMRDTVLRGYYIPSEVRYHARVESDSLDMALVGPILSGVVSDTRGVAKASLTLDGTRRNATLQGDIEVRDLSTKVDFTQVTYTVPEAHISVNNNHLDVRSATVFDPEGGRGLLSFNLSLSHLSNISYMLNVQPENMLVLNTTTQDNDYFYGKVYATGAATIEGDKSGVRMDIVAATDDNTEFYLPLSNKSNVSTADFVIFEQANRPDTTDVQVRKKLSFERKQLQRTSQAGNMNIDMNLNVRPNALFQLVIDPTVGDIIKGRGEGTIDLHINPRANIFEMYGDYNITEGSYLFTLQNIINKRFIIEPGSSIHWTGDPVDAQLNIDAVYKLKTSLQPLLTGSVSTSKVTTRAVPVECVIHLSDRLTSPKVEFEVEVPNADPDVQMVVNNALSTEESRSQQFLYLLVANSFISEASSDTASGLGATASAATGFELLSNQLSNWLSSETYNVVIRYRPKTDLTSDEVDIGFSTGLINNRLLLEVEGNYLMDRSMAVNQNSNIMGEAYLTWLIDRAGNLRLRGFTHTIDRFDENQGLQETGIGIYYKESFNNLKDLKQRVKERFTNRRRQSEREARREERKRRRNGGASGDEEAENEETTNE